MPRHDPLEDISIAPPPGSAAAAAATAGLEGSALQRSTDATKRRELRDKARAFVTADMLITSPVAALSITEVHHHAEVHGIVDPDHELGESDLRRMLVYCDAVRVQQGKRPLAVTKVEHTPPAELAAAKREAAAQPRSLPLSPSGEWKVTADHRGVALTGGIYPVKAGTIIRAIDHAPHVLESLPGQGVKLEPYPPIARESCPDCGTSYLVTMASRCPLCSTRDLVQRFEAKLEEVREHSRETRRADEAAIADVRRIASEQVERANQLGAVLKVQHDRHQALVRWAVAQGARPPDGDEGTTWQGEPHPPPLAPALEARNAEAAPPATVPDAPAAEPVPAAEAKATGKRASR